MKRTTNVDLDQLRSLVLIYTGSGATCSHKQIPEQLLDELILAVRADQRAKTWCEARAVVEDMLAGVPNGLDQLGQVLLQRMNEKEDETS